MKNRFRVFGIAAMAAAIGLLAVGCDQPNEPGSQGQQWTVSLVRNHAGTDNTAVTSFTHTDGGQFPANVTTPGVRTGYAFTGFWTARSGGTRYFDGDGARTAAAGGSRTLHGDLRLYAQWGPEETPPNEDPGGTPPNGDPEQEGQIPANLTGTWIGDGTWNFVLNADGSFTWGPMHGILSVSGSYFLMEFASFPSGSRTAPFSLVGNTLTITVADMVSGQDEFVFNRPIAWTASSNSADFTTAIDFTFDSDPGDLWAQNITIADGTGSATRGALTGSGTTRSLAISNVTAGTVSVSINADGIAGGPQTVTLVREQAQLPAALVDTWLGAGVLEINADGSFTWTVGTWGAPWSGTLRVSDNNLIIDFESGQQGSHMSPFTLDGNTLTIPMPEWGETYVFTRRITWTATPVGDPTNAITFTFNTDPGALAVEDFSISRQYGDVTLDGSAWAEALTGSGLTRTLSISNITIGDISVRVRLPMNPEMVSWTPPQRVTLVSNITWEAIAVGNPTPVIKFTFSGDPGLLSWNHFTIYPESAARVISVSGEGLKRTVELGNVMPGNASVSINRAGIVAEAQTVRLLAADITWEVTAAIGTPTIFLNLTFYPPVRELLTIADFRIVPGTGSATLTGDIFLSPGGSTASLGISDVTDGTLSLYIDREGFVPGVRSVDVVGPPELTGSIRITGTLAFGMTLSVDITDLDIYNIEAVFVRYQWRVGDNDAGTGSTLLLNTSHADQMITVTVTHPRFAGYVTSPAVLAPPPPPLLRGSVSIQGTPQVGQQLTAITTGLIGESGANIFQWRAGNIPVGTNSSTFTPTAANEGQTITVTVTRVGHIGAVISPATNPVAAAAVQPITWSATPSGSPTNSINFTFSANPTGLVASDITITPGSGSATRGALSGSGNTRTLTVSNVTAGTVGIRINRADIETAERMITLAATEQPVGINWTASAVPGNPTTTINLGFLGDPGTVTASNVSITNVTGRATIASTGTLPGTGLTRTLTIANATYGEISISINRDGIANISRTVNISGPPTPPSVFPVADITITVTGIPSMFVYPGPIGNPGTIAFMLPGTNNAEARGEGMTQIATSTTFTLSASPAGYEVELFLRNNAGVHSVHRTRRFINITAGANTIPWSEFIQVPMWQ